MAAGSRRDGKVHRDGPGERGAVDSVESQRNDAKFSADGRSHRHAPGLPSLQVWGAQGGTDSALAVKRSALCEILSFRDLLLQEGSRHLCLGTGAAPPSRHDRSHKGWLQKFLESLCVPVCVCMRVCVVCVADD